MLTTQYKTFTMREEEFIQEMDIRFTTITNEIHYLGKYIRTTKHVRKVLSILPQQWDGKVNAITEARNLKTMIINELVGNLKICEIMNMLEKSKVECKMKKNLVLSQLRISPILRNRK